MKKTRKTGKSYLKLASMLLFPCALFTGGSIMAQKSNTSYAEQTSYAYKDGYRESVNVANPSFATGSSPYTNTVGTSLASWTSLVESSKAKGMIINVGDKVETEDGTIENETFSDHKATYCLDSNPMTKDKSDNRILMINSKNTTSQQNVFERQGYKSTIISLEANSYYIFSVSALTMLNGDSFAECSIYLSGFVDKNGKTFDLGYEKISPSIWSDYYFFVATGSEKQDVTIQLYLGSKTSQSQGVAFFDNTQIYRYSENEFYSLCNTHNYQGSDSKEITNGEKIFMINKLATEKNLVADIASYNFDFEDAGQSITDNWTVIAHPNGEASIINYSDFSAETGYSRIGNDLSIDNDRALVMQTTSNEYSSSYIGLQSKQIKINPHGAYRVSLKLKIAEMESGSFYLKLKENNYIYEVYSSIISDNEEDKNYLALSEGKTSGYTSNTSNPWTNDYQTVDFYVKGHSLYTSYVNIELWLGDAETSAVGCVVIDDISVETVADSDINTANSVTLTSNTQSGTINNFSFDNATSDEIAPNYPLTATDWISTHSNENNCESGVVFLDENTYEALGNDSVYNLMYQNKAWAGINPRNSDSSKNPCNVYMMFNKANAYQTLQSANFELKEQEYYRVSFDYYNQLFAYTNASKFKVEIVDENGIVLFSQDNIQSLDEWARMDILFKAKSTKTHNVYVKFYFGEKGAEVGGMLYLDNLTLNTADASTYESAVYKTDTTGFFTKLDNNNGEVTYKLNNSSAYTFSATSLDSNYTDAEVAYGGIASGTNNIYEINNAEDNLLVLTTMTAAKASLKSKFSPVEFSANSYYKLTFSLATLLQAGAENAKTSEHDCNYGVSIIFDGYTEIENLTTGGALKEYTIYFKTGDTSSSPSIEFVLTSDCDKTTGTAVLTNLAIEESTEDIYLHAITQPSYKESVFSSEMVKEEIPENDKEEAPDAEQNTTQQSASAGWLMASSLITALALIIAVAGLVLRNVKIKKINKIKSEVYDRRLNQNHELVMAEAQKLRDEEIANLIAARDSIIADKEAAEQEHKEYLKALREEKQGKISRDVEKRFKQYTSKVATLNEKINIIKEKIDYTMSADHLIEIERKIIAKQDDSKHKRK